MGDAQRQCGDPGYAATLREAARLAMRLGEITLLVRAALAGSRGFGSAVGGVETERVEVLRAACAALADTVSAERAVLLAQLACELTFVADPAERRSVADEALSWPARSATRPRW